MTTVISDVFNRMLSASLIEDTVTASLKEWFPTYAREVERQMGLPRSMIAAPENYSDRNTFDAVEGEPLPKVVVIAPGTIGTPFKHGGGMYSASWRLGIGLACGAETETEANTLVKAYGAVVRGIMLQNSGLGTIGAADIAWTDEQYEDLPIPNAIKLVKAASLYFTIDINNVITRQQGPQMPDQSAYDYGEFETADVELDIEEGPLAG
jgi:hypothetical protein